jgi:hypothetical protein
MSLISPMEVPSHPYKYTAIIVLMVWLNAGWVVYALATSGELPLHNVFAACFCGVLAVLSARTTYKTVTAIKAHNENVEAFNRLYS